MSRTEEPTRAAGHDWVAHARGLAAAGRWTEAAAAYERALTELGRVEVPSGGGIAGTHIRLLGGFAVSLDDGPVGLDALRPQHRELLQVLCVFAGRPLTDGQLCAWFWPDAAPDRARHRLAVGVSALRALPGLPPVARTPSGYRLALDGETDVQRFERLVAIARAAGPSDRVAALQEAFTAYSGALLPAAGPREWLVVERDRLRTTAVGLGAELAERHARAGRHRDVVRVARAGLRIDRHHDRLWRRLVTALTELGEPAAAATARRDYTAVLVDLGVCAPAPPRVPA